MTKTTTEQTHRYNQLLRQRIGLDRSVSSAKNRMADAQKYLEELEKQLEETDSEITELVGLDFKLSWRDVFDCDKSSKQLYSIEILNFGYKFYVQKGKLYHTETNEVIGDVTMVE